MSVDASATASSSAAASAPSAFDEDGSSAEAVVLPELS